MQLTAEQRQQVTAWIEAGAKLSDLQQRLADELGLRMTYMEARFLLDDLKLSLKEEAVPEPEAAPTALAEPEPELVEDLESAGGVSVKVDAITRPGAMVSGRVTFSDGKGALWYLDQTGRLGLTPDEEGYRPPQPDVLEFQRALERELARAGL